MKDFFSTTVLALLAVAVLVGAWSLTEKQEEFVPLSNERVPVDISVIANRVLDSEVVGTGNDAMVRFSYIGERVTDKLDPEEVTWLRTESSWTRNRTSQAEYDRGDYGLETVVYSEQTFVKRPDGWHTIEHGEAPKDKFDQAMAGSKFFALFTNIAYAETSTRYSGVGDGYAYTGGIGHNWATAHASTEGIYAIYTDTTFVAYSGIFSGKLGYATIQRAFVPFDTSTISVNATISAATLNLYVESTLDADNDGNDYVTVVQTSQSTHTSLLATDFDQCGAITSPTEGVDAGQRKDVTSISTSAYLSFTLNSTGRGWIKKQGQASNCTTTTGISCFGIREGHDAVDDPVADDTFVSVTFSSSEAAGTSQDPYLLVTYTVPQYVLNSGGIWMGGGGGKLNVVGGKVQIN